MNVSRSSSKTPHTFKQWLMHLAVAFFITWMLQTFLVELVWMRSMSMMPALQKGDFMLISKLHYGARTPATWLKIPLIEPLIGDSIPTFLSSWQLPVFRLPGISPIKHNDVICFNHPRKPEYLPADLRVKFIGRCVGLPGDSVKINAWKVCHYLEDTLNKHYPYIFKTKSANQIDYLQKKALQDLHQLSDSLFIATCTIAQAQQLTTDPSVKKVIPLVLSPGAEIEKTFPYSRFFSWNQAFFGPLWIPRKGTSIAINDTTLALYDWLLEYEQGDKIRFSHDGYTSLQPRKAILNGKAIDHYTFEENYYFVLNDNRSFPEEDSRRFGLIPETLIIGKVWIAWQPFETLRLP
ncbi:MAG: signal peptidase I [Cytophagales bacterium]|nr:signal peptidase I [Bernardetiaceae bacterium]MDW8206139.1 signal peptidase I [Cytophagales bacterium]